MRITTVLILTLLALVGASVAHGHGAVFKSGTATIASPSEPVVLQYSTPVKLTKVSVMGPKGKASKTRPLTASYVRYDDSSAQVTVPVTSAGTYTLAWSVPQEDGHTTSQTHSFTVSKGASTSNPAGQIQFPKGLPGLSGLPGTPLSSRPAIEQDPKEAARRSIHNELSRIARIATAYLAIRVA